MLAKPSSPASYCEVFVMRSIRELKSSVTMLTRTPIFAKIVLQTCHFLFAIVAVVFWSDVSAVN